MLVGSRMEYVLRFELLEYLLKTGGIGDIRNDSLGIDITPAVLKFQADIVQRGFSLVNKDQLIRIERGNLTHDLTADGTGGTSYQHTLALKVGSHFVYVDLDRGTLKKVLDLDLFQLAAV